MGRKPILAYICFGVSAAFATMTTWPAPHCRSSQQDAERARRRVYDGGLNPGRDNMEFDEGPGYYLFLGCGPELTCGASLSHSLDATQYKQKSPWS